jgi:hypothetical protein
MVEAPKEEAMMGDILPSIIFPGDITALQSRLKAATLGTDQSVQACTTLDDATRSSWGAFYISVMEYVAQVPVYLLPTGENETGTTGTLYDRGQSLEKELFAWQAQIKAANCALTVPMYNPTPPKSALTDLVEYAAIGVAAVASAYIVGKVVDFFGKAPRLPSAPSRAVSKALPRREQARRDA